MNTSWEDQLTKYNDEEIEYDAIGNPIKIGNKTLTWTNGRQLKTLEQADRTINYFYNKDGIRVGKNSSGILCEYYLEGSNIVLEKRYTDMIYYIRDDVGSLIGMKYKDKMYYYIKNLQEDIIGIMDAGFNRVATYEYDAWGRILSIRDELGEEIKDEYHIARINPFRYRSYYYDEESGLYYLKSRYYNPVWGRFLNADGIIGTSERRTGYNLYSYVENNPVSAVDSDGEFGIAIGYGATKVAEAVIGGVILGITYIASKKATKTIVDVITNPPSLPDKKPKEKKEEKRNHTVYTLRDPSTDIYMYVGRTTNYKARKAAHRRNLARKNLIMEVVKDNLSYAAARGLEQIKINELKTLNKSYPANNQMNGVSPFNDNCKEYMQSGYRALYGETYVGGIEWCK